MAIRFFIFLALVSYSFQLHWFCCTQGIFSSTVHDANTWSGKGSCCKNCDFKKNNSFGTQNGGCCQYEGQTEPTSAECDADKKKYQPTGFKRSSKKSKKARRMRRRRA